MKKLHVLTGISCATLMSYGLVAQAGDSVNVSMPTNNPPVSEYNITLTSQSGKNWTYSVSWVRGKALSHWDLSLGSCLSNVTSITGGGTKQTAGDPSNANPASGADTSVKSSQLIKWDTTGGTFTITMDKAYQTKQVPVLAKTATVYNTGLVTGPDCTKEVVTGPTAEQIAADKAAADKAAADKAAADKAAADAKAAADKAAADKAAADKAAADEAAAADKAAKEAEAKKQADEAAAADKAAKDAADKAAKETADKEAADKAAKESADKAAKEAADKEAADKAAKESADAANKGKDNPNSTNDSANGKGHDPVTICHNVKHNPVIITIDDDGLGGSFKDKVAGHGLLETDVGPVNPPRVNGDGHDGDFIIRSEADAALCVAVKEKTCSDITASNGGPMKLITEFKWLGNSYKKTDGTDTIDVTGTTSAGTWAVNAGNQGVVDVDAIIVKDATGSHIEDHDKNPLVSGAFSGTDISNVQFCSDGVLNAGDKVCLSIEGSSPACMTIPAGTNYTISVDDANYDIVAE